MSQVVPIRPPQKRRRKKPPPPPPTLRERLWKVGVTIKNWNWIETGENFLKVLFYFSEYLKFQVFMLYNNLIVAAFLLLLLTMYFETILKNLGLEIIVKKVVTVCATQ